MGTFETSASSIGGRLKPLGGFLCITVASGLFLAAVTSLPTKWALALLAGTCFVSVIWVVRSVEKTLLILLILAIPFDLDVNFLFVEKHSAGMNSISFGLIDIFLVLLYVPWLVRILTGRAERVDWHPQVSVPIVGMIIAAGLSALVAVDWLFVLLEVVLLVKGLLIFLYVANRIKSESELRVILFCCAFGVLVQSILGLLQYHYESSLGLGILGESNVLWSQEMGRSVFSRVGGTIGYTNDYAKYLSFLFPITISLLFSGLRRSEKLFLSIVAVIMVFSIVATLSRVAWLGILISLSIVFVMHRKVRVRGGYFPAAVLLLILFASASQSSLIRQRFTADDSGSASSRFTTSKVALGVIADHPFLGVGANNYELVVADYGNRRNPETFTMAVHNMYLLHLAETGALGFVFFIWLNVNLFRAIWKATQNKPPIARSFAIGCLGAFAALAFQGFFDFGFKHNQPRFALFWLVVAVVASTRKWPDHAQRAVLSSRNS